MKLGQIFVEWCFFSAQNIKWIFYIGIGLFKVDISADKIGVDNSTIEYITGFVLGTAYHYAAILLSAWVLV